MMFKLLLWWHNLQHKISRIFYKKTHFTTPTNDELQKLQHSDPDVSIIIQYMKNGVTPSRDCNLASKVILLAQNMTLVDGILYYIDATQRRALVPAKLRERLLHSTHGGLMAGHFSGKRLYNILRKSWWWETMYCDCIQHCVTVTGGGLRRWPLLTPIPVERPFQIVGVDIMARLGNKYVLVFQDFLTPSGHLFIQYQIKSLYDL